jgi:DNA polymerase II small subunit
MDHEIINYANNQGTIITEDALRLLNSHNYKKIIDCLKEKNIVFITADGVRTAILEISNLGILNSEATTCDKKNFEILDKYDITGKKYSQGKVEDFLSLFLDKYNVLAGIIKTRIGFEHITIADAQKLVKNKPAHIIGMVYEKRKTKNDHMMITVDDPTSKVNLIIMKNNEQLYNDSDQILLDNVLGFKCTVISKDMFIVNDIIYPDIPLENNKSKVNEDTYLAIIADTHVGSKLFRENEFANFIDWLNGNDGDIDIVNKIKYLVIAGDLVDGIGIYPAQFDELAITDIFKQYELFEDYILKIPRTIDIFICSGNHDAVRVSDPQPAIPEEYLPRLHKQCNIHIMGSPSWVVIEGFKCLIYHGAALQGIYSEIKDITMDKPDLAMKEVLKRRDLMPQYGLKKTFVPMEKNLMVLSEVPDIFLGGDVHHHAYSKYKNTHLINASCWQSITSYQKEIGHTPTLSKVLLFNFKTQKLIIKDFEVEGNNE